MKQIKAMIIYAAFILIILSTGSTWQVFAKEDETNVTILKDSQMPLYDNSNNIVAYYFSLNNGGYIITNSDGSDFIEYSLEKQDDILNKSIKHYYSGPCSLYKEENNYLVEDCNTNEVQQLSAIEFEIEPEADCNEEAAFDLAEEIISVGQSDTTVIEEGNLKHSTKKYSYNPDGRCGAVAVAILLRYYDDYVDTKYIQGSYKTANGEKLINHLVDNYIGINTNYSRMITGLNKYLSNKKIISRVHEKKGQNSATVYSTVKSYIKNNKPLIVGLTSHSKYKEHWVVGTGYSTVYSKILGYGNVIVINDGWGNTGIRINNAYVDGCIYIK